MYVDGFVLAVPTKNLAAYKRLAQKTGKIWLENGALQFFECIGEDMEGMDGKGMMSFPKLIQLKSNETAVFSWIMFKSRTHRDRVNAKVMKAMQSMEMSENNMPFDMKRLAYGGFKVWVALSNRV